MAWEHGNLKTDTNTNYNITLFLSANKIQEEITGFKADIR